MSRRFSPEQTLQLVKLYREHECLWNIHSDLYRSPQIKTRALKKMCNDLDIPDFTVSDLKIKIKIIRSTYCILLDKIKKAKSTGTDYVPRVIWFEEINSYLRDVTMKKKKICKERVALESQSQGSEDELQIDYQSESEIDEFDSKGALHPVKHEQDPLYKDALENSFEECISSERKEMYQLSLELDEENPPLKKESQLRLAQPKNSSTVTELPRDGAIFNYKDDEFDTFGKHVASQLRKLSTVKNILAQKEIQCTITKFRMEDITG